MRIFFLCVLCIFLGHVNAAAAAYITEPKSPLDIPRFEDVQGETIYGSLADFPHTFTFSISEETEFSMQHAMNARQSARDVSLILIKQEKRGVSEIGRITGKETVWSNRYDFWRAITFAEAPKQTYTLLTGQYRLEVSSPENNRDYRLLLGEGDSSLPRDIFTARKVFEVHPLSILKSPFVFVFLLSSVGVLYYQYRKKRKHVS